MVWYIFVGEDSCRPFSYIEQIALNGIAIGYEISLENLKKEFENLKQYCFDNISRDDLKLIIKGEEGNQEWVDMFKKLGMWYLKFNLNIF